MDRKFYVLAAAVSAAAAGCAASSSTADDVKSAPIEMKGGITSVFLGSWKYIDGTYAFNKDGTYDVRYDYMRPAGPGQPDKHVFGDDKGSWSADDKYIYFKSANDNVIRDQFKLSADGSKLELYPKFVKVPEVLSRKK